jgi:hypothetical protein
MPCNNQITRLLDVVEPSMFEENFKEGRWQVERSYFRRRDEFFNALRTFFWAFQFQSWDDFLLFVITRAKGAKSKTAVC